MNTSERYCAIYVELFARYRKLIWTAEDQGQDPFADDLRLSLENLRWMATQCIDHVSEWPEDKINRWLGYIQGCLAMRGLIDVDGERAFTRPLFHALAIEKGLETPPTAARK